LVAVYQTGRTTLKLDYPSTVRLLIEAMLQSAPFLYHWELGPAAPLLEGKLVRLGPYEVASRLSYFMWGSMPDQALLDAAGANQLANELQLWINGTEDAAAHVIGTGDGCIANGTGPSARPGMAASGDRPGGRWCVVHPPRRPAQSPFPSVRPWFRREDHTGTPGTPRLTERVAWKAH
jgi:hypothetical protein